MPVAAETARDHLLQLLKQREAHPFLNAAETYLAVVRDDTQVGLLAAREYLQLGLVDPARDVLELLTATGPEARQIDEVTQQLRGLRSSEIPWSQRADRFESNLSALTSRGVDVVPIRRAWAAVEPRIALLRDCHDCEHVRRLGSPRGWFPSFGDHARIAEAQPLPQGLQATMPMPVLFDGLDAGWLFGRIARITRNTFLGYSCALFVVDPGATTVAIALHLHDWADLLADPRVMIFLASTWADELRELWSRYADLPVPLHVLTARPFTEGPRSSALELVQSIHEMRDREASASFDEISRTYAGRDRRYWARRFADALSGRAEPLRILAAVSTHTTFLQHSMRDARLAFESLGCTCVVLTEKTPYEVISPRTFHDAIRELQPDLFFSIDHLRPEFAGVLPDQLPVFTWDQDQLPHVFTRENVQRVAEIDFLAGTTKAAVVRIGANERQFLHSSVPTSFEQFDGPPLTDDEQSRYACDVSYVSHASQTPRAFHEHERSQCADPNARRLMDATWELLPELLHEHRVANGYVTETVLDRACRQCGVAVRDDAFREWFRSWYVWRLGDRMFRHEALEWAAQWARDRGRTLRLYGNGWDQHPTLAEFAAGPAQNGRELVCIHRASRINLQLMPAGFIHQRAMDGLAAGGFFLCRLVPHDLRGRALRRLVERARVLGIGDGEALFGSEDAEIQAGLAGWAGPQMTNPINDKRLLWEWITFTAELPQADEVFVDLPDVVFDSREEFAARADRYLADEPLRRAVGQRMSAVVRERFSYRGTMDRFLRAMGAYLAGE